MRIELISITSDPEKLIEEAGRTCYLSLDKITEESSRKFIRMIVKNGHHSVLEHAYATFRVKGCSRAFTHQIVRHRLCAFSQQSQRYVHESKFSAVMPKSIISDPTAWEIYNNLIKASRTAYKKLIALGIKKEDARFVLPQATASEIVVSANFREWRHIFRMRCNKSAQWEIRKASIQILKILKKKSPTVFEDFVIDEKSQTAKSNY